MRYRWNEYKRTDYKSKYKYVYEYKHKGNGGILYMCRIERVGVPNSKRLFETEREAAVAADKMLIKEGLEPVNVFKRKTN